MQPVQHDHLPRFSISGVEHRTLLSERNGARSLSIWEQTIFPGADTLPWQHRCEAAILVAAGKGELTIAAEQQSFAAPCTLLVPAHQAHRISNVGDEDLQITIVLASADPDTVVIGSSESDVGALTLPWLHECCRKAECVA